MVVSKVSSKFGIVRMMIVADVRQSFARRDWDWADIVQAGVLYRY